MYKIALFYVFFISAGNFLFKFILRVCSYSLKFLLILRSGSSWTGPYCLFLFLMNWSEFPGVLYVE